MAKSKKKATPTKVSEEQLTSLRQFVDGINQTQLQIGSLEVQKALHVERVKSIQKSLVEYQGKLKEIYGDVSVSIIDGTIKPIQDGGAVDKKN
jgi:hypothetical protein